MEKVPRPEPKYWLKEHVAFRNKEAEKQCDRDEIKVGTITCIEQVICDHGPLTGKWRTEYYFSEHDHSWDETWIVGRVKIEIEGNNEPNTEPS